MKQPFEMESLNYRQQFFDDAPVMYAMTVNDTEPMLLDVNETFLTTLGYTREQVIGVPLTSFYSPESAQRLRSGGYQRALMAEFDFEERELVMADGAILPVLLRALPLYDIHRNVVGTKAMFLDLTSLKNAQNLTRREQAFSQLVLDNTDAVIIVLNPDGEIARHNAAAESLSGFHDHEIAGRYFWDIFVPTAGIENFRRVFLERVSHSLGTTQMDLEWVTQSGEHRVTTWNFTSLLDLHGATVFYIASGIDITERSKAEQELRESEQRFRQVAENIRDVFYVSDMANHKMLYISPAYEIIWGRSCQSLYANPASFLDSIYELDRERMQRALTMQLCGESTAEEYRIRRPDGETRWIFDRSFPLLDTQGTVYRIVGIAEDITERKMAEMTLNHRLRLESLISKLSTQFVECPLHLLDDLIETCLAEIGLFVRAKRSYLLQISEDELSLGNIYEWCAQGVAPQKERLNGVPLSRLSDWFTNIQQGQPVNIERHSGLEAVFHTDGEIVENGANRANGRTVVTILAVPLQFQGRFWGVLGFDAVVEAKYWIDYDLKLLQVMGEVMVHTLQQRSAQEMLSRIQRRTALALNASSDGLFEYDVEADDLYLSPRIYALLGYPENEGNFAGTLKDFLRIVHPDEVEDVRRQTLDAWVEGTPFNYTGRLCTSTGDYRWFMARGSMIVDPHIQKPFFSGFLTDVTSQKAIESVLRENEEYFRLLGANSQEMFYIFDVTSNQFLYVSSAYERIWGYQIADLMQKPELALETIHPDDRAQFEALSTTLCEQNDESAEAQYRVYFADGSIHWVWDRVSAVRNADGLVDRFVGVVEDITEQRLATQQLTETAERLSVLYAMGRHLVNNGTSSSLGDELLAPVREIIPFDLAIVIDHEQHFKWLKAYNGSFVQDLPAYVLQDLLSYADGHIGSQNGLCCDYRVDENTGTVQGVISDYLYERGMRTQCYVPLRFNRQIIGVLYLMANGSAAFSSAQTAFAQEIADLLAVGLNQQRLMRSLQSYAQDLEQRVQERTSQLSRANAEITRINRMKDEFLANMSHELRTPLNAILVKTELMQEGLHGPLTEKQTRSLDVIHESSSHLLELINDILDLSKIEANMLELEIDKIAVSSLCQSAVTMVREMAMRKGIDLQLNGDLNFDMQADMRRLKQILVNLLVNAIKFTPPGGKVGLDVESNQESDQVRFTVWDTGIGIAESDYPLLFRPFVQLDGGTNRQYGGTGLGLPLVRRLAELHDGRLEVESTLGVGSRFAVVLPWRRIPYMLEAGSAGEEFDEHPELAATTDFLATILIVDDNDKIIESLHEYFTYYNYQVLDARNGFECLERLEENYVQLAVIDIQMPKIDGLETIRRVRKTFKSEELPIIALTALTRPGDRERCLEAGADAYMPKPFSLEKLRMLISELLRT